MIEASAPMEPSQADQRRNQRYVVSQQAMLTLPGSHPVGCEIVDYCVGGMFLRFIHPDIAIGVLARRDNATAAVSFTPGSDESAPNFVVRAQIKRLAPHGVGVAFSSPPVDALLALQKLRMTEARRNIRRALDPESTQQIRATAWTLLADTLNHALDIAELALPDKLRNASILASRISEHNALVQAPLVMTVHRKDIRGGLLDGLKQRLDHPDEQSLESLPSSTELALIEETQFEDWLATASEVSRLDELFRAQLADLLPRASQAFEHRYDPTSNPFGPGAICHGFRVALDGLELSTRARQIAYANLREALAETLGLLYAELLALFPPLVQSAQAPAPPASPYRGGTPPASTADSAAPVDQGTLGRLTSSLLNFFRGGPAVEPQPDLPAAAPLSDTLSSPVLRRLNEAGQLPPLTDPAISQSIQLFGALFDTMHASKSVEESARPFFKQLEATLMKLALADPNFLSSPAHPAHKVLNTLDRLSMVAGDDGHIIDERLLRLMNRWTDRINAEAETNPGIFEEARSQLERVIKPLLVERNARVFRLQEMCEGRQRVEEIRRGVVAELFARHGDNPVPNLAIDLLNGGWRNILVMAELRGAAGDNWATLERLFDWLAPDCPVPPTVDEVQALLRKIDAQLAHVCADKFAQDRLLDQLASALLDRSPDSLRQTALRARLGEPPAPEVLSETQLRMASRLRIGDWLEFDEHPAPLNLVWSGDSPPVYVFANYRGIKKLDLKQGNLLNALEEGRAHWAEDMELPLMDRSYGAMIQKMQRELAWQASHDSATGLSTAASFYRNLRRAWLRRSGNEGGYLFAAIHFSLDIADGAANSAQRAAALRALAEALRGALPADAQLSRLDEDTLAWSQISESHDSAYAKASALQMFLVDKLRAATPPGAQPHTAIGLVWRDDCFQAETYCDLARTLGNRALESGISVLRDEASDAVEQAGRQQEWGHLLDEILEEDRLELICHPVVSCENPGAAPSYYEIVLHVPPSGERLTPTGELITMAERLGRCGELDRRVLHHLFLWMRAHADRLAEIGGFACKISAQALADPAFLNDLVSEFAQGGIPANKLIFSIAEAVAVEEHAHTHHFLRQLRRYGCRFMLDSFGNGASSYVYLKSLQLDYLKLDRLLLRDIETSVTDEALVRSIVETARFLSIRTVGGFVETLMLSHKLGELGVDLVQGYAIADPRLLEELGES